MSSSRNQPRASGNRLRALFAAALLALIVAIAASGACANQPLNVSQNDFVAPSGLTITSARDRDLLFIASSGGDELRALNLCTTPTADGGGYAYKNTCPANEDFHFVPGPIRVFSGGIETADRPTRLASVRLCMGDCSDGGPGLHGGAVLVSGSTVDSPPAGVDGGAAGSELRMIDPSNVVDGAEKVAPALPPAHIPLEAPPVDVVAPDQPGSSVPVWVVTQSTPTQPAQLVGLRILEATDGSPQVAPQTAWTKCSLPLTVVPRRLALVPGADFATPGLTNFIYVADGATHALQSALEIDVASLPAWAAGIGPPCTVHRPITAMLPIPDGDGGFTDGGVLPFRALALSPLLDYRSANPDGGAPVNLTSVPVVPAGAEMIGVTVNGLVTFVRMADGITAPIPPYGLNDVLLLDAGFVDGGVLPDGGAIAIQLFSDGGPPPAMEPLRPPGLAREVAFLLPPPESRCPSNQTQNGAIPFPPPCTVVYVGNTSSPNPSSISQRFPLVAVTSSSEGGTFFLEALQRRFVNDNRDNDSQSTGSVPTISGTASLTPSPATGQPTPTLTFPDPAPSMPGREQAGWLNAGVTRQATWRAIFHAAIPGLERRAGVLTQPGGPGTPLHFQTSPGNLDLFQASPDLALSVGDLVAFSSFETLGGNQPDGGPINPLCPDLANFLGLSTEVPILGIPDKASLDLGLGGVSTFDNRTPAGFNPASACFPVGATAEVRAGSGPGKSPWVIFEGNLHRGRAQTGAIFIANRKQRDPGDNRFDYPLDYAARGYLPPSADIAVAFTINAPEPVISGTNISFLTTSGQAPTGVHDASTSFGFAGPTLTYTSPKVVNLVFTSITGSNTVLQVDPALIGVLNGVISYR